MTIFLFGVLGLVLNKTNLVLMIMSIELIILAINLNFIFFSLFLDDFSGQIFSILILALAAAESSIGLSFLITYYRNKGNISVLFLNLLKN
jgi:NADH-quinone oxidoreductase subunit K